MATTTKGIYYPNDGTKAADILEDLKQMAETIDDNFKLDGNNITNIQNLLKDIASSDLTNKNNISNLQNRVTTLETDNTQNKSDINTLKSDNQTNKSNISTMQGQISDIQQEQQTQNTNIEELQENDIKQDELLIKYKNALLNAETEEAKSLYVEDANKFGSLEVLGNHEQEMRSGKNLLNFSSLTTQTVNGLTITNNNDGSITLNGTTTDIVSMKLSQTMHNLVAGNYYLSRNSSGTASGTFTNILYGNNGTAVNVANLTSEGMPLTTTTDYEEYYLWLYIKSGITFTNYTIKPQLEAGTVKTDWEQYGASPSPDYPSKVVCLGSNKQLFDKDNANKVYGQSNFEVTDNGLKIINTGSLQYMTCVFKLFDVSNCKGKNFTVKTKFTASKNNTARVILGLCNEDGTERQSGSKFINISGDYITYNVPSDLGNTKYLALWLYSNFDGTANPGDYVLYEELKIEEGDTATSYSPYRTRQY